MARNDVFSRLAQQIGERLQDASQAPNEVQRSVQSAMRSAFDRLELVSREDFDVMMEVLQRTRARVEALEKQVTTLEATLAAREGTDPSAAPSVATADDPDVAPVTTVEDADLDENDTPATPTPKPSTKKTKGGTSGAERTASTTTHNAESKLHEQDAADVSAKAADAKSKNDTGKKS